jgi:hypothetical protein
VVIRVAQHDNEQIARLIGLPDSGLDDRSERGWHVLRPNVAINGLGEIVGDGNGSALHGYRL